MGPLRRAWPVVAIGLFLGALLGVRRRRPAKAPGEAQRFSRGVKRMDGRVAAMRHYSERVHALRKADG